MQSDPVRAKPLTIASSLKADSESPPQSVSAYRMQASDESRRRGQQQRLLLTLTVTLFFAWGFAYGLLDVLNKHFQDGLQVSPGRSALLQSCYFTAYFIWAVPSGLLIDRIGYRRGIQLGLCVFAVGSLVFIPATASGLFWPFLVALFILASGAACMETAANPLATVLGAPGGEARRLNLAQAFTGLGIFFGPIVGGFFFFRPGSSVAASAGAVRATYIVIAIVIFLLAAVFSVAPAAADRQAETAEAAAGAEPRGRLWSADFVASVVAQFFYFGAQVGIAAFFINLTMETWHGASPRAAAFFLSIGFATFTVARFLSTALLTRVAPERLLTVYAGLAILLSAIGACAFEKISVIALIAVFAVESTMFPTIFALGTKDLGGARKRGASIQIMALFGGAVMPFVMGWVYDRNGLEAAYAIPVFCFLIVFLFALRVLRRPNRIQSVTA